MQRKLSDVKIVNATSLRSHHLGTGDRSGPARHQFLSKASETLCCSVSSLVAQPLSLSPLSGVLLKVSADPVHFVTSYNSPPEYLSTVRLTNRNEIDSLPSMIKHWTVN